MIPEMKADAVHDISCKWSKSRQTFTPFDRINTDFNTPIVYWPMVESSLGIVGACLPMLRPLFVGAPSRRQTPIQAPESDQKVLVVTVLEMESVWPRLVCLCGSIVSTKILFGAVRMTMEQETFGTQSGPKIHSLDTQRTVLASTHVNVMHNDTRELPLQIQTPHRVTINLNQTPYGEPRAGSATSTNRSCQSEIEADAQVFSIHPSSISLNAQATWQLHIQPFFGGK